MPSNRGIKLFIHSSQTSTAAKLKLGNELVISSHTLLGMRLFIHSGKLKHVVKGAPSVFILQQEFRQRRSISKKG